MNMKNLKKIVKFVFILSISFLLLNSCKKKKDEEEPRQKIEINEQTKVMPVSSREHIESISPDTYTFVFNGTDDFINGLEVGNILVDGISEKAPYGYLRKITKITENKSNKQFQTELVTLPEAVPSGSIAFSTGSLKISDIKSMTLAKGVKLNMNKDPNFTAFDFTYEKVMVDPDNPERKVSISGKTTLELDFFFNFDWAWDIDACPTVGDPSNGVCIDIKLFETGVEITQSGSISIAAEVGANFEEEIILANFLFDPWAFSVGPVPVVILPKIKVILKANGEIVAIFSASASESFTGRLGVKYENDNFGPINDWVFNKDFVAPQLEINAKVEAHVGPQASLLFYGAAGPFINLTACDKFEGTLKGNGNWDLEFGVGIAAEIGIEVDLLGWDTDYIFYPPKILDVSNQFCLGYWSLLHLENESFDDQIYIAYPTDGSGVSKDSDVTILTEFTGQTPDEVQFFIDGILLGSDTDEPFEYIWNTTDYTLGAHAILVKEFAGGDEISSDEANVVIENAHWVIEDMISIMSQSSNFTRFHSMSFKGSNRWISGTYADDEYNICGFTNSVGFIWYSSDNGNTWEEIYTYTHEGGVCYDRIPTIYFVNDNTGYLIRHGSGWNYPRLWKTTDGGYSWNVISGPYLSDFSVFENFYINNQGQIVGFSSKVHREGIVKVFDAGGTILEVANATLLGYRYNRSDLYGKGNTILAFDRTEAKYSVSHDGGNTWNNKSLPAMDFSTAVFLDDSFLTQEIGFISVRGGTYNREQPRILKTTDAANTWQVYDVVLPEGNNNRFEFIHFVSEQVGYAWGSEAIGGLTPIYSGIYKTIDGGQTWGRHYEIPELIIRNLDVVNKGGLFFNGASEGYAISNSAGHKIYHFTVD